ncbi:membrane protein related to metalloendopeptidases [Levilinea saccharolytica]|nr:LysM peptidoglycan-binding domain-containing M23 family metallopeptidase [Levilinea saccharolytica]GAP18097.1 membrane protein related to metalloendopeptidases [Levilinea saccharolytica]
MLNFSRSKPWGNFFLLLLILFLTTPPVQAQNDPQGPIYVVQSGDTLNVIAMRFGVSVDDIILVNNIANPNLLAEGTELIIPGLEGVSGRLVTLTVPLGQNLLSLSREHGVSIEKLAQLNRLTSPQEIYAGSNLIIPQESQDAALFPGFNLAANQTWLEAAVLADLNPWQLMEINRHGTSASLVSGQMLYQPGQNANAQFSAISPVITSISILPLPFIQGKTSVLRVETNQPVKLTARLFDQDYILFEQSPGEYLSLIGTPTLLDPGLVPFDLNGSLTEGSTFSYSQMILLDPGYYGQDPPLEVDPATLDPEAMKSEEEFVTSRTSTASAKRLWEGAFAYPIDEPCIRSWFGNRRSYNNGVYTSFHAGLDFGVCAQNLNIYAAAPGKVVFAGPLAVRGNSVIIDHGWGVYTGYWHLNQIAVAEGDVVDVRQVIGEVGATGRVTGPHLHFEVRVNGFAVDPLDWLETGYPQP